MIRTSPHCRIPKQLLINGKVILTRHRYQEPICNQFNWHDKAIIFEQCFWEKALMKGQPHKLKWNEHADGARIEEHQGSVPGRLGADDFGRTVSKVAAAQICESVGFHGSKESAMDALADILIRYLFDLGKTAKFYANLTGRTECNIFDIIRGLEDLEAEQGFPLVQDIDRCLAGSRKVKDIATYVSSSGEIPFAQPVPNFTVVRNMRLIPSFIQMDEKPPVQHIPTWLPAFPDPHTYIYSPMWNERSTDPRSDKIEQARQQRKAERSLLRLQERLVSDGSVVITPASASADDTDNELQLVESNVSLEPTMNLIEKDVAMPEKLSDKMVGRDNVSVLEAFAPAIQSLQSGFCDDGEDERRLLPDTRPAVHLGFRADKKFLGISLDLSLPKKGVDRLGYWFGKDEERDDKKRRAEYILRQSMENTQELTQM